MAKKQSLKYLERQDVHWEAMLLRFLALWQNRRPKGSTSERSGGRGASESSEFWIRLFQSDLLPGKWGVNSAVRYGSAYYFALNQSNDDPAVRSTLWTLENDGGKFAIALKNHVRKHSELLRMDRIKIILRMGLGTDLSKPREGVFDEEEINNMAAVFRSPENLPWIREFLRQTDSNSLPFDIRAYRLKIREEMSKEEARRADNPSLDAKEVAKAENNISRLQFILSFLKIYQQTDGLVSYPPNAEAVCKAIKDPSFLTLAPSSLQALSVKNQDVDEAKKAMVKEDKIVRAATDGMIKLIYDLIKGIEPPAFPPKKLPAPNWEPTIVSVADLRRVHQHSEVFRHRPFLSLSEAAQWDEMLVGNGDLFRPRK